MKASCGGTLDGYCLAPMGDRPCSDHRAMIERGPMSVVGGEAALLAIGSGKNSVMEHRTQANMKGESR